MTVPTFQDRRAMWSSIDFPLLVDETITATLEYAEALAASYGNGAVLLRHFELPSHPVLNWYVERNRLRECFFFERFWHCPSPSRSLSALRAPRSFDQQPPFHLVSPVRLGGYLAGVLWSGGAYSSPSDHGGVVATRLARAVQDELVAGHFGATSVWLCNTAWSDFFFDVAWDVSVVVVNTSTSRVTVLVATDTD